MADPAERSPAAWAFEVAELASFMVGVSDEGAALDAFSLHVAHPPFLLASLPRVF